MAVAPVCALADTRNSSLEFVKDREVSLALYPSGRFLPEKVASE
jgi:hypothetical protein